MFAYASRPSTRRCRHALPKGIYLGKLVPNFKCLIPIDLNLHCVPNRCMIDMGCKDGRMHNGIAMNTPGSSTVDLWLQSSMH